MCCRPWWLTHIGRCYGVADRIWIMDRGVPTEEVLGCDLGFQVFYKSGSRNFSSLYP